MMYAHRIPPNDSFETSAAFEIGWIQWFVRLSSQASINTLTIDKLLASPGDLHRDRRVPRKLERAGAAAAGWTRFQGTKDTKETIPNRLFGVLGVLVVC
jgi:hypothetical protein